MEVNYTWLSVSSCGSTEAYQNYAFVYWFVAISLIFSSLFYSLIMLYTYFASASVPNLLFFKIPKNLTALTYIGIATTKWKSNPLQNMSVYNSTEIF